MRNGLPLSAPDPDRARGRLNLSKSGIGGSVGRTGLRLGLDAKRKSISLWACRKRFCGR